MLLNIAQASISVVVLWLGIVFGLYMLFTVGLKAKSPSAVIRILYGIYGIALFFYAMILSPISHLMQIGSTGFYIGIGVLVLVLIPLIVNSLIHLIHKTKKEGK